MRNIGNAWAVVFSLLVFDTFLMKWPPNVAHTWPKHVLHNTSSLRTKKINGNDRDRTGLYNMVSCSKFLNPTQDSENLTLVRNQCHRARGKFKLGFAFKGANLHPEVWDDISWSIGGTGIRCHEEFWNTEGNNCLGYVNNEKRRKVTLTAFESFLRGSKPVSRCFFARSTTAYIGKDRRHVIHMLSIPLTLRMDQTQHSVRGYSNQGCRKGSCCKRSKPFRKK